MPDLRFAVEKLGLKIGIISGEVLEILEKRLKTFGIKQRNIILKNPR